MTNGFYIKKPTDHESKAIFYLVNSSFSPDAQIGEALFCYLLGPKLEQEEGIEIACGKGFKQLSESEVRRALKQYLDESG